MKNKIENQIFNIGYQNMSINEIAQLVKKVVEKEFPNKKDIKKNSRFYRVKTFTLVKNDNYPSKTYDAIDFHFKTGDDLPMCTYIYEVSFQDFQGWKHQDMGHLFIVR